jgi:hypothetical protein
LARDSRAEYHGVWQPASNCCHDRIHERHYFLLAAQVSRTCCPLRHDLSSAFSRWSDTIRKNVWINMQLHITTRNTISSTCWDLLEWLAFAWFLSHGHTDLEGQLISSTTKNPNRRQCLHQLIRSLKTIHAFHRTSAISRHSHILCEVGGRLEPGQPE